MKAENLDDKSLGKNFVFDNRMSGLNSSFIVSKCHPCEAAFDTHRNCKNESFQIILIKFDA